MKYNRVIKPYELVGNFERQTSHCPLYLAWQIVDEARAYFRTPLPESFADLLARRAEIVFAKQPSWQRRLQNRNAILTVMRHWLAGVLARENPALFRQLPESFKLGHPLPQAPLIRETHRRTLPKARARSPFVHGCELLPV